MIYPVEQNNYSSGFRKELYNRISQGYHAGMRNVKKFDAWYWYIDIETIDVVETWIYYQEEYSEYLVEFQKFLKEIECAQGMAKDDESENNGEFEYFREKLFSDIKMKSQIHYVIGDIVNKYSNRVQDCIVFDFMDKHKRDHALKLFISKKTIILDEHGHEIHWDINSEARIGAYVQSYFDTQRGEVQLKALSIQLLGPCSRDAEYDELAELYPEEECQELVLDKSLPQIALIAGENHGKKDFIAKINKKLQERKCIEFIKTNMCNIREIVSAIEKKNQEHNVDILVLVRGGGNAEDMCIYNNKLLLDAIKNSKIPVVVGIGHKDDKILAERVAVYGASTPTDAANYINRAIGKFWESRKIKKDDNLKLDYEALKEENQNLREENEQLRAEIKRLKNRGIFSRLINL